MHTGTGGEVTSVDLYGSNLSTNGTGVVRSVPVSTMLPGSAAARLSPR